eukprot:TRINITY_DN8238_c1_g1_i2.p1 TRINITY_DN8238_c1_g1~~TRINITY_DN8238_c1_g1_i2.p1  ORF type:complete len:295 (-),score=47.22 TRINITY_DN8238_c1_g1_i2:160-1044(-)
MVPSIFRQSENDTVSSLVTKGEAFVLTCTLFETVVRWTIGCKLLQHNDKQIVVQESPEDFSDKPCEEKAELERVIPTGEEEEIPHNDLLINTTYESKEQTYFQNQNLNFLANKLIWFLGLITVPIWAAMIALVVGLIPPVKALFFHSVYFSSPPLNFVIQAMKMLGSTFTPLILLILGAQIGDGPDFTKSKLSVLQMISILTQRLLLIPLLLSVGIIHFLFGEFLGVIPDHTMRFVLMVTFAMPTAVTLVLIAQIDNFMVNEMSTLCFFMYLCSTLTMTFFICLTLMLLEGSGS